MCQKCYFFSSYFYSQLRVGYSEVARWTKKLNEKQEKGIFGYQFLFFPINQRYALLRAVRALGCVECMLSCSS
jgi:Ulp1 family protease